ncbi:hypothetical protein G7009_01660 [Pseudomonas capeferrum]|uniref:hypothetical protein n=1 Tax=Pseudomonas capeferrum TaxID=1495066 RepID=UPI0015E45042|nr:hypothetical protein [Pseudomonas capeferrum]MBA1200508.1 hypothetical protein [Pseudomonas capeferrum]
MNIQHRTVDVPHLNIAQSIRRSSDPYRASIACFTSRDVSDTRKTFYFEDGSRLAFQITYTAVEDGTE